MRLLYFVLGAVAAAVGVFACGDDDSTPGTATNVDAGGTSSSSSSSSSGGTSGSTPTDSGSNVDAAPIGSNGVIHIADRGTTYDLNSTSSAYQLSQGYNFSAVIVNAPGRTFSFLLRRGVRASAGSAEMPGDILPGTYSCAAADATVDTPALRVVQMQYDVGDDTAAGKFATYQAGGATGSCTVELKTFDAVGGHTTGTITATVKAGASNPPAALGDLSLTGTFDLIRTN